MNTARMTTRLAPRFGPGVASWCAGVPELAGRLAAKWRLTLGEPIDDGASSVAIHCTRADGSPAVLKLGPDPAVLTEQAAMLRLLAPSARVPELFAATPEGFLMAAVRPGTSADELPEPPSAAHWATLLTALHATPPPVAVRPLRERTDEMYTRIGRRLAEPAVAARIPAALWRRATDRCADLLRTDPAPVLLHGDLHPGNVLDGGPAGLIAIDPKVCLGDPCFDAVDHVLAGAGRDGVTGRCAELAPLAGLDPDRLLRWARVIAPVVAIAHLADPDPAPLTELLALAT